MRLTRTRLLLVFSVALGWAQLRESSDLAGLLDVAIEPRMPARVYLFKDGRPFRLSPVQALLPLRVDLFYRERLWRASATPPETLEVTCNDQSHFFLLKGRGSFELPAGKYRLAAYRGHFYAPASVEFELKAGETRSLEIRLDNWAGAARSQWLSADDHIHLTRAVEDNDIFLSWLEAEDLSVGNFLQLQRQMDASVQYAFGEKGEARRGEYTIRPGHESRSEFFGHVNLLGGQELIRPLSVGTMYANSPETYPYPTELFARGRALGATVGYAHFQGSMPHSTLLMDLALGNIDFIEVFQFGVLKTEAWYELLNAGLKVTGIAGSDFPANMNRQTPWPGAIPLLGPERTLVKIPRTHGGRIYDTWAAGVRGGRAVVTNGPLIDLGVDSLDGTATATATYFRPLERAELIVNGEVAFVKEGDGKATSLTVAMTLPERDSIWIAARTRALKREGEPEIQAHTNPVYLLANNKPVMVRKAREALAKQWAMELAWYRTAPLVFPDAALRDEFFARAEKALEILRAPLLLAR